MINEYALQKNTWFQCKAQINTLKIVLKIIADHVITLMTIDDYYINGYWWLLYYKLLLVIICYIMTIDVYYIINYCWIFYVIIS